MKPFWIFHFTNWGFAITSTDWGRKDYLHVSDRDVDPFLAPEAETPLQVIGRFFLNYAYSTPAGVAYRLTYGVPKCEE
jgi:hypothetical protein